MRLPRDVSGRRFATLLRRRGYEVTRQKSSHIRLTTNENGTHHVTIPDHDSLRIGTLNAIMTEVAAHFALTRDELIEELFG